MAKIVKDSEIKSLFFITHIDNLQSILKHGILSHNLIEKKGLKFQAIYDAEIVTNRKLKQVPDGSSLWDFANVYFQPRNPMLYRVIHEKPRGDIIILGIRADIMQDQGVYITDGNAANNQTFFYPVNEGKKVLSENWGIISSEWWKSTDGSKRKIMAECLVPNLIPPEYIHTVYVAKHDITEKIKDRISGKELSIIPEPKMFFNPINQYKITEHLSLAEGDMFFSNMQTLTVSVNTVGIMGKGLASRAKYQFPDVYVVYQDACRKKWLTMGKPFLYKREASFDEELIDEPNTDITPNAIKWFLLFATKRDWREDSDIEGIENGLIWITRNFQDEGIKSLALPALGCGLGKLEWRDVGPLMCQYLEPLHIPIVIYLPREKPIPRELLKKEFLLRKQ